VGLFVETTQKEVTPLFGRRKDADPAETSASVKVGGKGHPTPSRKEAEAAARARAKGPRDKKEAARLQRQRRNETNAKAREGMRRGDDRYLPRRDKGPVRRFVRDWIDARLCAAELLLPLLILIMVTQSFSTRISSGLWSVMLLLVSFDTLLVVYRLRRELRRRFAGRESHSTKGAVGYAVLRSIQLRWLRLPKAQVKLGTKLPDTY
jgi:hypothetical protein